MLKTRPPSRSTTSAVEPRQSGRHRGDAGTGLVLTVAGVTVFLAFLLFATQLLVGLYATSVLTSVTHQAAHQVATNPSGPFDAAVRARAEAEARQALGRFADRVEFSWAGTDVDYVRLHVHAENPRLLVLAVGEPLGFETVDRVVEVRVERFR